jgi:hypothetical protein
VDTAQALFVQPKMPIFFFYRCGGNGFGHYKFSIAIISSAGFDVVVCRHDVESIAQGVHSGHPGNTATDKSFEL